MMYFVAEMGRSACLWRSMLIPCPVPTIGTSNLTPNWHSSIWQLFSSKIGTRNWQKFNLLICLANVAAKRRQVNYRNARDRLDKIEMCLDIPIARQFGELNDIDAMLHANTELQQIVYNCLTVVCAAESTRTDRSQVQLKHGGEQLHCKLAHHDV